MNRFITSAVSAAIHAFGVWLLSVALPWMGSEFNLASAMTYVATVVFLMRYHENRP